MTLTFTQENGLYVAEFEATAPFSIHLERPRGGFINMLQRSVDSGTFVAVKNFNPNYNATQVIDADCGQGAVYPKWIRLESAVEPSVAEVTFESESSGGGAGTESTMKYYLKPTTLDDTFASVYGLSAQIVKADIGQKVVVSPSALLEFGGSLFDYIIAFGVNLDTKLVAPTKTGTVRELFGDTLATYTEITKEQFYNLEA